jgi:Fe2+ or Zn2+ uptake regulation protein
LHAEVHIPSGFSVKRHEVVLYGACRECSVLT